MILIIIVCIVLASLVYYFADPGNHNSWNSGGMSPFSPKTKGGKASHVVLSSIGLVAVWIIIIGIIIASFFQIKT